MACGGQFWSLSAPNRDLYTALVVFIIYISQLDVNMRYQKSCSSPGQGTYGFGLKGLFGWIKSSWN